MFAVPLVSAFYRRTAIASAFSSGEEEKCRTAGLIVWVQLWAGNVIVDIVVCNIFIIFGDANARHSGKLMEAKRPFGVLRLYTGQRGRDSLHQILHNVACTRSLDTTAEHRFLIRAIQIVLWNSYFNSSVQSLALWTCTQVDSVAVMFFFIRRPRTNADAGVFEDLIISRACRASIGSRWFFNKNSTAFLKWMF